MKRITKQFTTLKQAESYLMRLYNKYDNVKVVATPPIWRESGTYIYEVK